MPRVKIDYVVSMSSEDPENPASNLLAWDVSKKKWLCKMGETSCSVVLQLARAIQIESITIGTYHTSLLEVLVGSSEKPNDTFEVLVPSCVVCSPREARGEGVERVKSFTGDELSAARHQRWDRLRLVCSQPYNRRCQYGLSFVHVSEREGGAGRALRLDALASDDEDLSPGELFFKHEQDRRRDNTETQIRQATSRALNRIDDSATKIIKTPIAKTKNEECERSAGRVGGDRRLVCADEDEEPRGKVDRVMGRHEERKRKDDDENEAKRKAPTADSTGEEKIGTERRRGDGERSLKREIDTDENDTPSGGMHSGGRKRTRGGGPGRPSGSLLSGVVFAISGYANPRRAAVRAAAIRMGARYTPDVTPDCTHLICAFPDTPKLRRAPPGVRVVTADWVENCERSGRGDQHDPQGPRGRHNPRDPQGPRGRHNPGDPQGPRVHTDEAQRSDDTDDDDVGQRDEEIDDNKTLPAFLEGITFAVSREVPGAERALLERYITAYGGVLLKSPRESPQYVLSASGPCGARWLWACHARRRLLPVTDAP